MLKPNFTINPKKIIHKYGTKITPKQTLLSVTCKTTISHVGHLLRQLSNMSFKILYRTFIVYIGALSTPSQSFEVVLWYLNKLGKSFFKALLRKLHLRSTLRRLKTLISLPKRVGMILHRMCVEVLCHFHLLVEK